MRSRSQFLFWCATAIGLLIPSVMRGSDTLLIHGHIYTGNAKAPWVQALAITGTRIDAVGTDQEILARREPKTQVIDLQGRTVIPGISDSHTHMWFGAMALHGINLSTPEFSITPDNADVLVEKIKDYAAGHPQEKILFGRADFSIDSALNSDTRPFGPRRSRPPINHSPHQRTRALGERQGAGAGGN